MCSDDILTLAAATRGGAYFNFWCAKCFVTNFKESSDLKIPSFSDEENKSITNQSKDSPYRPNYCKFYQVKKLHLILVHFQDKSICVCSLLSPVSSLLLAELNLQGVPGAQGDEGGLGEAQEHQEDTLEAEDKVAGH